MESKEYFEKVMLEYNQNRKGRSLRKYCKDEAVDYDWLIGFKKHYPQCSRKQTPFSQDAFLPVFIREGHSEKALRWEGASLVLQSPQGERLEIRSTSLFVVAELLHKILSRDKFYKSTPFFIKSTSTDMRKGHDGLASIVREVMGHNPQNYNEAFIFYSKDYRKVKILHYDINGWVLYSKWFTDGKFLKTEFEGCKKSHELSRETLILILFTSVQTK